MRMFLLAATLALGVVTSVGAQEQVPSAVPSTTTKSRSSVSKPNSEKKTEERKHDTDSSKPENAFACCPNCCPVEAQTKSAEEQAKADSLDRLYRRYLWATIIGVIFAFLGLCFIALQAIYTKRSIEVQERPWIIIKVVKPIEDLEVGKKPRIRMELINTGKSPAFECSYETWTAFGDRRTTMIPEDALYYKVPFPTMIYHNTDIPVEISVTTKTPLTATQTAGLATGDVRIVSRVRIEYTSAFKKLHLFRKKHFAEFGYTVSETAMGPLPEYNRAD